MVLAAMVAALAVTTLVRRATTACSQRLQAPRAVAVVLSALVRQLVVRVAVPPRKMVRQRKMVRLGRRIKVTEAVTMRAQQPILLVVAEVLVRLVETPALETMRQETAAMV